jgi:hypothetical protein
MQTQLKLTNNDNNYTEDDVFQVSSNKFLSFLV